MRFIRMRGGTKGGREGKYEGNYYEGNYYEGKYYEGKGLRD